MPLAEKPQDDALRISDPVNACAHLAWEVTGRSSVGGVRKVSNKCSDCGHRWTEDDLFAGASEDELKEALEEPGKPPKAVYGHAQVVTYQTEQGQYDLVVGELTMVSLQQGVLVLEHPQTPVTGIVAVRPWLNAEESDAAQSEG